MFINVKHNRFDHFECFFWIKAYFWLLLVISIKLYHFYNMEGQCNRHLLHFYVHHQYCLHNHQCHFNNLQIHVSENHLSYNYYHHRSLTYFYMVVLLILYWFLFHQYYYPILHFLPWLYGSWVILFPVIKISESFFLKLFLGIQYPSVNIVVLLPPCTNILETLRLSLINFLFLFIHYFGCCSLVYLSSKLADEIDPVLVCGFTVSSVSVIEEDLYLSNEVNLFNVMSLSESLLIRFSFLVCDASFFSVLKGPIMSLTVSSAVGMNGLLEDTLLCLGLFLLLKFKKM